MEKVPEPFGVQEMMARVEERTPYIVVAFQECERMNFLTAEIRRSLKELALGLKVYMLIRLVLSACIPPSVPRVLCRVN